MMRDEIITEIRQIGEAYAEKFNDDIYAMWRDLKNDKLKIVNRCPPND